MKTIITTLTILTFFIVSSITAQEFSGRAIYKTSRKSNFKIEGDKSVVNDKMKEEMQKRIQKMNQKTYILEFDKFKSTYIQEVSLESPTPNAGGNMMFMSFGGSGNASVYYKNVQEKKYSHKTDIMGKVFLVKDKLPQYDWVLSSETKNIGMYTCYKATFSKEVENTKITLVDGKPKEEKEKVIETTTAWYTPQVPISNGPSDYQGLPGLILEINDGKTTIVCTEIILNPTDKLKIEAPKKGKVVTQEKFDKISEEKTREMMERFRSRDGKGIEIKIGG
jgi:GLPGLI family protein